MTSKTSKCSKCGGAMEEGFLPDRGHGNAVKEMRWAAGRPKEFYWTSQVYRHGHPVVSFRCKDCGYLELFARNV